MPVASICTGSCSSSDNTVLSSLEDMTLFCLDSFVHYIYVLELFILFTKQTVCTCLRTACWHIQKFMRQMTRDGLQSRCSAEDLCLLTIAKLLMQKQTPLSNPLAHRAIIEKPHRARYSSMTDG